MKIKHLPILLIILILSNTSYPWGKEGHKMISKNAINLIPAEMSAFKTWGDYITEHSSDADMRKSTDRSESPKHFIDIDFYKEFKNGNMLEDKAKLISVYNDSIVTHIGLLPWATQTAFNNLTEALKNGDRDKALIYAADLGHYVADGFQPLHTVLNYNGKLTGQKGIHFRYESDMLDAHLNDLEQMMYNRQAQLIEKPLDYIFNYIEETNSVSDVIFNADNFAFHQAGERDGDTYYKLLWFRTKYITAVQLSNASHAFASLLYTAWVNAGKPSFDSMK